MNTFKVQKRDMETKAKKLRREGFITGNLFGKEIEVTCVIYPYAEVYYTRDKKWCFPYNFIASFVD